MKNYNFELTCRVYLFWSSHLIWGYFAIWTFAFLTFRVIPHLLGLLRKVGDSNEKEALPFSSFSGGVFGRLKKEIRKLKQCYREALTSAYMDPIHRFRRRLGAATPTSSMSGEVGVTDLTMQAKLPGYRAFLAIYKYIWIYLIIHFSIHIVNAANRYRIHISDNLSQP